MQRGKLQLPVSKTLPGNENGRQMPYGLIGNETFPLRCELLGPFPAQDCHVHGVVENTFSILTKGKRHT